MSLSFLITVLFSLIALVTAVTAVLVAHSVLVQAGERRLEPVLNAARAELVDALVHAAPVAEDSLPAAPTALRAISKDRATRLILRVAGSFTGDAQSTLAGLAGQLGLIDRARRLSRSRWWWRRLDGARLLIVIGEGDDLVPRLAKDRDPFVRAQAADSVFADPSPAVLAALLGLLEDEDGLCRFAAQDALIRLGEPSVDALGRYLLRADGPRAHAALEVAAAVRHPALIEAAAPFARHSDPGLRARAAAVLGSSPEIVAIDVLQSMLTDVDPTVRVAAVRSLGAPGPLAGCGAVRRAARRRGLERPPGGGLRSARARPCRLAAVAPRRHRPLSGGIDGRTDP